MQITDTVTLLIYKDYSKCCVQYRILFQCIIYWGLFLSSWLSQKFNSINAYFIYHFYIFLSSKISSIQIDHEITIMVTLFKTINPYNQHLTELKPLLILNIKAIFFKSISIAYTEIVPPLQKLPPVLPNIILQKQHIRCVRNFQI